MIGRKLKCKQHTTQDEPANEGKRRREERHLLRRPVRTACLKARLRLVRDERVATEPRTGQGGVGYEDDGDAALRVLDFDGAAAPDCVLLAGQDTAHVDQRADSGR